MLIPKAEKRIEQILSFIKGIRYRELSLLEFEYFETVETHRRVPENVSWEKISLPFEYGKDWHCSWFRTSFEMPLVDTTASAGASDKAGRSGGLYLKIIPNADSLVFLDGKPAGAFNPRHKKLKIEADGKKHELHIEAYAGHHYPGMHPFQGERVMLTLGRSIKDYPNVFEYAALLERMENVYGLYYDALCLYELSKTLDDNSLRKVKIISGLYDALMDFPYAVDMGDSYRTVVEKNRTAFVNNRTLSEFSGSADDNFRTVVEKNRTVFEKFEEEALKARAKIKPLLEAVNGSTVPKIHLVGHAHLDHAWLWHIGETERKAARTYINMCRLAEEYPDFVFLQSQSAQLEIVKREYPEIFEEVKKAYAKGNWDANGGMWVEADCNITGGESLIRQFLIGKRAFAEALGGDLNGEPDNATGIDTLWLPDVFGYAAALPQILAGCGIKYFITSKINWNDTTRFPYDTFIWKGLDGTGIKTHFITSRMHGYNGRAYPDHIAETWNNIQHKELHDSAIKPIGEGDGGGGTTRGDLEMAKRMANLEGAPKTGWKKVSAAMEEIFAPEKDWPEWSGELYLELHRGTYTTQALIKKYNRKMEAAIRNAEFLSAIAFMEKGIPYPHERLLKNWKVILTNQFHDIIPGSSINRVNVEAVESYREVEADLNDLTGGIRKTFALSSGEGEGGEGKTGKSDGSNAVHLNGGLIVFNDLSWERNDPVIFPAELAGNATAFTVFNDGAAVDLLHDPVYEDGDESEDEDDAYQSANLDMVYPIQRFIDLDGREMAIFCPTLPSLGWTSFLPMEYVPESPVFFFRGNSLKTPFYEVNFDRFGRITSLYDTVYDREFCMEGGCLNAFITAQDLPLLWEAWDMEEDWKRYAKDERELLSTSISASGKICFQIRRKYKIGTASVLTQDMVFYAENNRIDFDTHVDWKEKNCLLKVSFDTAIKSSQIRCDVQYGNLIRNTHRNLPQDRARFEFPSHKWICLEEEGRGIALMNDCKYGHDANDRGRISLTLLRSPKAPDSEADMGDHRFKYSLLPYIDSIGSAARFDIIKNSYELNHPAMAEPAGKTEFADMVFPSNQDYSFMQVFGENIIVEAIKMAEPKSMGDGRENCIIVRLYECLGGNQNITLSFRYDLVRAALTNMLEEEEEEIHTSDNNLSLEFRPYEIKTLLVEFILFN